jgi:predicted O-methyltransferase YrrM
MLTALQAEYRERAARASDIREQMPVLYAWARHASQIVELGVGAAATQGANTGNSTSAFLAGLEHSGGTLWSVDIADPTVPAWWSEIDFWHFLRADDTSPEALKFCPGAVDLLFIDTSHLYTHTMEELSLYAPRVKPGGTILLHDTGPGWPDVGRALNDWCPEAGRTWYDHPGWPGLGVIEVPGA